MRFGWLALLCALGFLATATATPAQAETRRERANKELVLRMWQGVIVEASDEAVMRYIAPDYIQHNPNLPQGRAGLLEGVARLRNPPPGAPPHRVKRLIASFAKGDLVALIWEFDRPDPERPGATYPGNGFDMFRVRDGLVIEHWDDVPKRSASESR
ncbi:MAG: nuclear transport factor 2 family protein [Hyphomonadaceae bacterium]|nr:nuclear transport factor 2 family protein [Hyphomonadaceae bacterium]